MPKQRLRRYEHNLHSSACGGILRNRRRGRTARALSTRFAMHLVLRSTIARGSFSFAAPRNRRMIASVLSKHAASSGVQLLGTGNAGNHLHIRMRIPGRVQYCRFIRAIAGEIALKIKNIADFYDIKDYKFWNQRSFSSILSSANYAERVADYVKINELEGYGYPRAFARLKVQKWRDGVQARRAAPS